MRYIVTLILLVLANYAIAQGDYKTHTVKNGETVESIAKQYLITSFDIYALNPDAKTNFSPNMVLIIPSSKVKNEPIEEETKQLTGYTKHKVRRKETLFSISQKFNVTIDDIKKANRYLYSENLKKGDRIQIPKFKTVVSKVTYKNTLKTYKVQPKEGKWRIAYKFGITTAELEALNPNLNEVLQPGDEVYVPNIDEQEEKVTADTYNYYEVLPKEGFYRLNIKLGLSQEQLEALNPELKNGGLKAGMVLKLPKDIFVKEESEFNGTVNLADNIYNFNTKKIALLLPYRLNKIDIDSVQESKDMIRNNTLLSAVLDYHSGMQMALDSVKQLGVSVDVKVFDTEYRLSKIRQVLNDNDFSEYDAVIGPMKSDYIDLVATTLQADNVPLVVPMSKAKKGYSNMFQTVANDDILQKAMVNYVKKDTFQKNIIIMADRSHITKAEALKSEFPTAQIMYSQKNKKTGKDDFFIYKAYIEAKIKPGLTVVFLETTNNSFASSIVSVLNGLSIKDKKIVLVTTDKNRAFNDNIDNIHLSNLNFHYPSVNNNMNAEDSKNGFINHYKATYGVYPNRYAIRGFDVTLDVLMRLASSNHLLNPSNINTASEQLENKFQYKASASGGYVNEAVYIQRYDDLRIRKVD